MEDPMDRSRRGGLGRALVPWCAWALVLTLIWCGCERGAVHRERAATAIAWLEPLGKSGAEGSISFVASGGGVLAKVELEGLEPGRYVLLLRRARSCSAPGSEGGTFERLEVQARSDGKASGESSYDDLDLDEDGRLVGASVVVEGSEGRPVACGVVKPLGSLYEESRGRFQGPPT
jgi:hypothetical protein